MGKTETIKDGAICVYLPSIEMAERQKERAEKQGTSISKFVLEHVENSLRQEEEPSYKSRGELLRETRKLKEELDEEQKRSRRLDLLVEKLEKELRRYRAKPFLEEGFEGVRSFQKELVELIRKAGALSSEAILSRLGIDRSEHEASQLDPRDRAIITLFAKTGIRREELIDIDLDDIDWAEQSIMLRPKPKRSLWALRGKSQIAKWSPLRD